MSQEMILHKVCIHTRAQFTKGEGSFATLDPKKIQSTKNFWQFAVQLGHDKWLHLLRII